jgi:hypothetical protein
VRTLLIVSVIALLGACTLVREQQLRDQMDAEMSQCRAGDQAACQRYKLVLARYQTEVASTPRCGLLGLPCPGYIVTPPPPPAPLAMPMPVAPRTYNCDVDPYRGGAQVTCQ